MSFTNRSILGSGSGSSSSSSV